MEKLTKTDEEWRRELTPEQYHVLRRKGTERAFTGEHASTKAPGLYRCAGCGAELFPLRREVRVRQRLAELLRAGRRRRDRDRERLEPRDAACRGALRDL